MLSNRAERWLSEKYGLMEGMSLASKRPFDLDNSPDGCINLGTAENELMFPELQEKTAKSASIVLRRKDIRYNDFNGTEELRQAAAQFLNDTFNLPADCTVDAAQICFTNGCGSAIESLFHVLCDQDDSVIIPAPYYGGFDMDLERRPAVRIIPAHLSSANGYRLTVDVMEQALKSAKTPVRALLLMNPSNPLGIVYDRQTIEEMIEFCNQKQLHLVVDEIYALSIFDDNVRRDTFTSVLAMLNANDDSRQRHRDFVHFIWGFSKDFCVNGFRAGLVVSHNQRVVKAMAELSYFTGLSTLTQRLLTEYLTDRSWYQQFFATNQQRLKHAYSICLDRIRQFNMRLHQRNDGLVLPLNRLPADMTPVRFLPASAGFFLWVDFSFFLRFDGPGRLPISDHDELVCRERQLFLQLITEGSVYLAPGAMAFHGKEPGWFRISFACRDAVLQMAFDRLFAILESKLEQHQ